MRRVIETLRDNDGLRWFVKVALILFWLLVPAQGHLLVRQMGQDIRREWSKERARDLRLEQKARLAIEAFALRKSEAARSLDARYGPEEYFQDLIDIQDEAKRLGYPRLLPTMQVNELMHRSWKNVEAGHFPRHSIDQAREKYKLRLDEALSGRKEAHAAIRKAGWRPVWNWLWPFYLWSMALVLLLYLLAMIERKGILPTVLADPTKFFLAVVCWPWFLTRYPANVLREIVVEAELRRLGRLFRRLNPSERLAVREIAASDRYADWLHGRKALPGRRAFALALIATVICWLFLPGAAHADPDRHAARQGMPTVRARPSRAGPVAKVSCHASISTEVPDGSDWHLAWLVPGPTVALACQQVLLRWAETVLPCRDRPKDIFHVPLPADCFARASQPENRLRLPCKETDHEDRMDDDRRVPAAGGLACFRPEPCGPDAGLPHLPGAVLH